MSKATFVLIILCLLLVSCRNSPILTSAESEWLQKNDKIKVALFAYYPPYQFKNEGLEDGEVVGIFVDYLSLMEKKLGYQFERVEYEDWTLLINDAKNGKIDVILEIQETKARRDFLFFHEQLFNSQFITVMRENNTKLQTFEDLAGLEVVLPKDYAIIEILKQRFPNLKTYFKKTEKECLKALSEGKYDAFVGAKAAAFYTKRKEKLDNLIIGPATPYDYKPSMGVSKQQPMLHSILKKASESITMREKGEIYDNWLFKESTPFYLNPNFWFILMLSSILITLTIFFHNWKLKTQVIQKTYELREALKMAEKSDRIKTNFLHNISHEIRTPLNGILGCAELLSKEETSEPEKSKFIDTMMESSQQLTSLVDDILEISYLQTQQPDIHFEETNLNELFCDIESFFRSRAMNKGLLLQFELPDDGIKSILIDKGKLTRILRSLIDNAIKFTNDGFVKIKYLIRSDNRLELTISDSGIGIHEDERQVIFEHFLQAEKRSVKKVSGLGLGLAILKENLSIMGGEISFDSKPNEGSTFRIYLPFKTSRTSQLSYPSKIDSISSKNDIFHILIAEDEDINFFLANMYLSRIKPYHFHVHRALDGAEAVQICKKIKKITLVLMDIRMPVMDGYEAIKLVKEINPELPVIAYTAYAGSEDIRYALDCGFEYVLEKPTGINEFREIVLSYLEPRTQSN